MEQVRGFDRQFSRNVEDSVVEVSGDDSLLVEDVSTDDTDPLDPPGDVIHDLTDEDSVIELEEKQNRKRKVDSPELGGQESKSPHLTQDEIFTKLEELTGRFPDADPGVLFSRLESGTPLEQIVAELETPNPAEFETPPVDDVDVAVGVEAGEAPGPSGIVRIPTVLQDKLGFFSEEEKKSLKILLEAFPDVDPMFVLQEIVQHGKATEQIVDELSKNSGYPKLKKRMEMERREKRRQEFLDRDSFDPEVYLRIFEDPETHFMNEGRNVSALYVEHTRVRLINDFPNMRKDYLTGVMKEHGNLYLPTLRAIQQTQVDTGGAAGGRKGQKRSQRGRPQFLAAGQDRAERADWPEEIEETFFRELQYALYQQEIKDYKEAKEMERGRRLAEGREEGILEECQICFDDECLPEEMVSCRANRHKFCHNCIRTHAETQIGDGQHRIKCLSDECNEDGNDIPLEALRGLLRPNMIDVILKRTTEEEVRNAGLENFERCPFCDFALIMDNQEDRVFRCRNPECLKESCRECHLENHIPLKCKEVEKPSETRMRIFIENRMAEAMIRICPKCQKRLIKNEGCNKLVCACGTQICYVCSERLEGPDPYGHFQERGNALGMLMPGGGRGKKRQLCPLHTTMEQVHADVAEKAGKEAKEQYLKDHPELKEEKEKKDVKVEQLVDRGLQPQGYQAMRLFPGPGPIELNVPPGLFHLLGQPGQELFPQPNYHGGAHPPENQDGQLVQQILRALQQPPVGDQDQELQQLAQQQLHFEDHLQQYLNGAAPNYHGGAHPLENQDGQLVQQLLRALQQPPLGDQDQELQQLARQQLHLEDQIEAELEEAENAEMMRAHELAQAETQGDDDHRMQRQVLLRQRVDVHSRLAGLINGILREDRMQGLALMQRLNNLRHDLVADVGNVNELEQLEQRVVDLERDAHLALVNPRRQQQEQRRAGPRLPVRYAPHPGDPGWERQRIREHITRGIDFLVMRIHHIDRAQGHAFGQRLNQLRHQLGTPGVPIVQLAERARAIEQEARAFLDRARATQLSDGPRNVVCNFIQRRARDRRVDRQEFKRIQTEFQLWDKLEKHQQHQLHQRVQMQEKRVQKFGFVRNDHHKVLQDLVKDVRPFAADRVFTRLTEGLEDWNNLTNEEQDELVREAMTTKLNKGRKKNKLTDQELQDKIAEYEDLFDQIVEAQRAVATATAENRRQCFRHYRALTAQRAELLKEIQQSNPDFQRGGTMVNRTEMPNRAEVKEKEFSSRKSHQMQKLVEEAKTCQTELKEVQHKLSRFQQTNKPTEKQYTGKLMELMKMRDEALKLKNEAEERALRAGVADIELKDGDSLDFNEDDIVTASLEAGELVNQVQAEREQVIIDAQNAGRPSTGEDDRGLVQSANEEVQRRPVLQLRRQHDQPAEQNPTRQPRGTRSRSKESSIDSELQQAVQQAVELQLLDQMQEEVEQTRRMSLALDAEIVQHEQHLQQEEQERTIEATQRGRLQQETADIDEQINEFREVINHLERKRHVVQLKLQQMRNIDGRNAERIRRDLRRSREQREILLNRLEFLQNQIDRELQMRNNAKSGASKSDDKKHPASGQSDSATEPKTDSDTFSDDLAELVKEAARCGMEDQIRRNIQEMLNSNKQNNRTNGKGTTSNTSSTYVTPPASPRDETSNTASGGKDEQQKKGDECATEEEEHEMRLEEQGPGLNSCQICYEECTPAQMVPCNMGRVHCCQNCVVRLTEKAIGAGERRVLCPIGCYRGCHYPAVILMHFLPEEMFEQLNPEQD